MAPHIDYMTAYLHLHPVYQGLYNSNFAFHYFIVVKHNGRTTSGYIIYKEETNNLFQIIYKLSNGMKMVIMSPEQNAYANGKQPHNVSVIWVDVCFVYLQNLRA